MKLFSKKRDLVVVQVGDILLIRGMPYRVDANALVGLPFVTKKGKK